MDEVERCHAAAIKRNERAKRARRIILWWVPFPIAIVAQLAASALRDANLCFLADLIIFIAVCVAYDIGREFPKL